LAGQVLCPRSPPNSLAMFTDVLAPRDKWVVNGICAYVPQVRHFDFRPLVMHRWRFNRSLGSVMLLSKVPFHALYALPADSMFETAQTIFFSLCLTMKSDTRRRWRWYLVIRLVVYSHR
jgi:hypothetical protein